MALRHVWTFGNCVRPSFHKHWIKHQQNVLVLLEAKYKAAFPAGIYDGYTGGDLRVLCYSHSYKLTWKQVIGLWQAVIDYLQEIIQ